MNDFDYDALQKKRIARGAFSRKGPRGRKGCMLPHEYLTTKERKALNGEVYTVNTTEKLSWERFKQLPVGLQAEYLNALMKRFDIGLANISRDLFGMTSASLYHHCQRFGVRVDLRRRGKIPDFAMGCWHGWIDSDAPVSETTEEPSIAPIEEDLVEPIENVPLFRGHDYEDGFKECGLEREVVEQPEPTVQYNAYPLTNLSMTLKGTTIELLCAIQQGFASLMDPDKNYRVQIQIDDFVL